MQKPWKACLIDYLRSIHNPNTRASYFKTLSRFFAAHEPEQVTRREIEVFIRTRYPDPHRPRQGELAAATQNARLGGITSFYEYASSYVPEGATEPLWNKANPTKGIARGDAERSPKGLSPEELQRLFSVIPTTSEIGLRDRAALLLTFWTGRRRSEVGNLVYGDIIETVFPDGQGGTRKASVLAFRGKGHQSEKDHQEIPHQAMEAITWYLVASGRMETIGPEDPLFLATWRGQEKPLSGDMLAKRVACYTKQAGVKASMHSLRHSAAKARYSAGASVQDVQHLLRHSSIATTDVYLRRIVGVEDTTASLLEDKFRDL